MCQPDSTPTGISVSTCTMSRPGIEDGLCWISVRLSLLASASRGGCGLAAGYVTKISLNEAAAEVAGGPRPGRRRYRPRLPSPRRRQQVPGTHDVCGLRAFMHVIGRKSGDVMPAFGGTAADVVPHPHPLDREAHPR